MVDVVVAGARLLLDDAGALAQWDIMLGARSEVTLRWSLAVRDSGAVVIPASSIQGAPTPGIVADDRRLAPFVEQGVADLQALRMSLRSRPHDDFFAAGSPWYLTLFGRDSIWAARMALPLGTELAGGTLRALASLQGAQVNPATDEQPGKILHELRRSRHHAGAHLTAADLLRHGGRDPAVGVPARRCLALGDAGRRGSCPAARDGAGAVLDGGARRRRRGRIPRLPRRFRPRPGEPGLEGLRRFRQIRRRNDRGRARSRWPRCRATPTRRPEPGPTCWTRSAGPAASAGGGTRRRWLDRFRAAFWVDRRARPVPGARP